MLLGVGPLATALAIRLVGDGAVVVATVAMTALVLIFAEVMPKTYAITGPEATARRVAGLLRVLVGLLAPVVSLVRALVRLLLRVFGVETDPKANLLAGKEEIAGAIVLGHTHKPMLSEPLPEHHYLNPGAWFDGYRYAVLSDERTELTRFTG